MGVDREAPRVSREVLLAALPEAVKEALPLVPWRIERLWQLDLLVLPIAVSELEWLLELPLWQLDGVRFQVSPRQVWEDPNGFPDHLRRVMASDLRYPIHLVEHNGRLVVLDGFHRLLKAVIQGRQEIYAMVLSRADLESVCASA